MPQLSPLLWMMSSFVGVLIFGASVFVFGSYSMSPFNDLGESGGKEMFSKWLW